MLPSGPRSTYDLPPRPQVTADGVARQMIATIRDQVARSNSVRTGTMTTGCDGSPVINPLDGTSCNGDGGQKVLFNPQTRTVLATIGRQANGVVKTVTSAQPASCATVLANLRTKRRFTDNLGNVYGPDGAFLTNAGTPAMLETDYVHRLVTPQYYSTNGVFRDPPLPKPVAQLYLEKTSGVVRSVLNLSSSVGLWAPSVNDIPSIRMLTHSVDLNPPTPTLVLEDCVFRGSYTGSGDILFWIVMDSVGAPDTFNWHTVPSGPSGTAVPMTGLAQSLAYGVSVQFGATTGHSLTRDWPARSGNTCDWIGSWYANNNIVRNGVGVRGTIERATACVNAGFPNNNVLLTTEDDAIYTSPALTTSHAIVVRDPDSLAQLYRKALVHDGTGYAWGTPGQKFSFSANDEGLFFMQCYTEPSLTSPPTPYPGAEFGAPDNRKIAVISVNPLTFEPTIIELITLQDTSYSAGSSFAVASTLP